MAINIEEMFSGSTESGSCALSARTARRGPSAHDSLSMTEGMPPRSLPRLEGANIVLTANEFGDIQMIELKQLPFPEMEVGRSPTQVSSTNLSGSIVPWWPSDSGQMISLWDPDFTGADQRLDDRQGSELVLEWASTNSMQFWVQSHSEDSAEKFSRLVEQWRSETAFVSSATDMAMHPAYQAIIGMGEDAVPLLLRELERAPDHWFWALKAITGADPVPDEVKGQMDGMAQAWLRWGQMHCHRW